MDSPEVTSLDMSAHDKLGKSSPGSCQRAILYAWVTSTAMRMDKAFPYLCSSPSSPLLLSGASSTQQRADLDLSEMLVHTVTDIRSTPLQRLLEGRTYWASQIDSKTVEFKPL